MKSTRHWSLTNSTNNKQPNRPNPHIPKHTNRETRASPYRATKHSATRRTFALPPASAFGIGQRFIAQHRISHESDLVWLHQGALAELQHARQTLHGSDIPPRHVGGSFQQGAVFLRPVPVPHTRPLETRQSFEDYRCLGVVFSSICVSTSDGDDAPLCHLLQQSVLGRLTCIRVAEKFTSPRVSTA